MNAVCAASIDCSRAFTAVPMHAIFEVTFGVDDAVPERGGGVVVSANTGATTPARRASAVMLVAMFFFVMVDGLTILK